MSSLLCLIEYQLGFLCLIFFNLLDKSAVVSRLNTYKNTVPSAILRRAGKQYSAGRLPLPSLSTIRIFSSRKRVRMRFAVGLGISDAAINVVVLNTGELNR